MNKWEVSVSDGKLWILAQLGDFPDTVVGVDASEAPPQRLLAARTTDG